MVMLFRKTKTTNKKPIRFRRKKKMSIKRKTVEKILELIPYRIIIDLYEVYYDITLKLLVKKHKYKIDEYIAELIEQEALEIPRHIAYVITW